MPNFRRFLIAGISLAAITGATTSAHATAYAFGVINFTNLSLTGLTAPGVSVNSANVTTRDSAGYPDFASQSNAAAATNPGAPLTAGSDVLQAYSGPGPAPAENTFSQALTNAFGTRGDAILQGNLLTGVNTGASDVAEGHINVPGSGSSTAGTSTGFNIVLSADTTQTFTLSFNANDMVMASTTLTDEIASASVSASFTVSQRNATTGATTLIGTYSPNALNMSTTATSPGDNFTISNPDQFYIYSITLDPGTYQFSLLSGAQEQVTSPIPIPEPVSLALLSSGLLCAGLVRRRLTQG